MTDFFTPEEYDDVIEISDVEAYGLCGRLHLEESIIAGPSCGLALGGALRAITDEPGVVAVIVFPDNAYKYLSSFRRHLPDIFPFEPEEAGVPANPFAVHLEAAFAQARSGPDVIDVREAKRLLDAGVTLIDVRNPPEIARMQIPQSVTLSLPELSKGSTDGLPTDLNTPMVMICAAGTRSLYALLLLKARGYRDVRSVDGGMGAWVAAGLPAASGSA